VESKRASRKEMLYQKTQPAIYGIEKENFKTLLTLTKKENSLFSGCRNTMEKLASRIAEARYIGKTPFAKIPE
jgi:hypothetical protein